MTIVTGQTLDKQNLPHFRKKLRAPELQTDIEKVLAYIEHCLMLNRVLTAQQDDGMRRVLHNSKNKYK